MKFLKILKFLENVVLFFLYIVLFQNCVRQSKLSHQDGHHSAVALLLKAALIQVSDYRLQGASGYSNIKILKFYP
jgi:predicted Kef-type K+ transport protein